MKRIETLQKEARAYLDDERRSWNEQPGGVDAMAIARAMDKLRDAERVLRQAFDQEGTRHVH